METLQVLSRNEMKKINAGYVNPCGAACNRLYGGYYEDCFEWYHPSTDNWGKCVDEVYALNSECLAEC